MIPLMTRRSSTRRAPGWFCGKSGSIAAQARSDNQKSPDIASLPLDFWEVNQQYAWKSTE
jgi:hypothetical protein